VTVERNTQTAKQRWQSLVTEEGIQIDKSDERSWNARQSIDETLESDSNVTVARDPHLLKQATPSAVTEEGMQIDESDEHFSNAERPIDQILEPDSN
jgi:hypothetical protein